MTPCVLVDCTTIDQLHTQRYAAVLCDAPIRNESRRIIVTIWVLFSLALTSVTLRFVARTPYFGGRFGWDDWTILMLLALQIPLNITHHYLIHFGFGQDLWMLEEYQIVQMFKVGTLPCHVQLWSVILTNFARQYYMTAELLYMLGMCLLKISVLLQYLRIFNFRTWAYSLMALSTSYGVAFMVTTLAACKPFSYYFHRWQAAEYSGTCIDRYLAIYASSLINIILDGAITLLPTTQMQVSIASSPGTESSNVLTTRPVTV